jgi:hypothetical protein
LSGSLHWVAASYKGITRRRGFANQQPFFLLDSSNRHAAADLALFFKA